MSFLFRKHDAGGGRRDWAWQTGLSCRDSLQVEGQYKGTSHLRGRSNEHPPIKVTDTASLGNSRLSGKLNFQPCDARRCLFPRAIPVSISANIIDSPEAGNLPVKRFRLKMPVTQGLQGEI
jgi:hypothetical protein